MIDEKYPTIPNCFNSFNNVIITYEMEKENSIGVPETGTPVVQQKVSKEFSPRNFKWETITR